MNTTNKKYNSGIKNTQNDDTIKENNISEKQDSTVIERFNSSSRYDAKYDISQNYIDDDENW